MHTLADTGALKPVTFCEAVPTGDKYEVSNDLIYVGTGTIFKYGHRYWKGKQLFNFYESA